MSFGLMSRYQHPQVTFIKGPHRHVKTAALFGGHAD